MRVIDFHNHIWLPSDPDGDDLVRAMDAAGVQRMVIHACPRDIWSYTGDSDDIVRAVRKHPDRFIGTMHLDFRAGAKRCVELVRRYSGEGLRGAKMFPNLGFEPDAPDSYPIYEAMQQHGLFAAFHLGYSSPSDVRRVPLSTKYTAAFCLEEVAILFPKIRFVICHMGGNPGYKQTLCVLRYYANIYADTAPGHGVEAFRYMGKLVETVAWDKIMFGSDSGPESWPSLFEFWMANAGEGAYVRRLGDVFHDNASRFLTELESGPR